MNFPLKDISNSLEKNHLINWFSKNYDSIKFEPEFSKLCANINTDSPFTNVYEHVAKLDEENVMLKKQELKLKELVREMLSQSQKQLLNLYETNKIDYNTQIQALYRAFEQSKKLLQNNPDIEQIKSNLHYFSMEMKAIFESQWLKNSVYNSQKQMMKTYNGLFKKCLSYKEICELNEINQKTLIAISNRNKSVKQSNFAKLNSNKDEINDMNSIGDVFKVPSTIPKKSAYSQWLTNQSYNEVVLIDNANKTSDDSRLNIPASIESFYSHPPLLQSTEKKDKKCLTGQRQEINFSKKDKRTDMDSCIDLVRDLQLHEPLCQSTVKPEKKCLLNSKKWQNGEVSMKSPLYFDSNDELSFNFSNLETIKPLAQSTSKAIKKSLKPVETEFKLQESSKKVQFSLVGQLSPTKKAEQSVDSKKLLSVQNNTDTIKNNIDEVSPLVQDTLSKRKVMTNTKNLSKSGNKTTNTINSSGSSGNSYDNSSNLEKYLTDKENSKTTNSSIKTNSISNNQMHM